MGLYDFLNNNEVLNKMAGAASNFEKLKQEMFIPARPMIPQLRNPQLTPMLREEREKINALIAAVYYNTEQISSFQKKLKNNPESSELVIFSIVISLFLIMFCVALPLLMMPVGKTYNMEIFLQQLGANIFSLKGLWVGILTLLVSAIFVVFGIKNYKMKYLDEDLKRLENCTKVENYSEYLKFYLDNTKEDIN
jgi:hypothetical protein